VARAHPRAPWHDPPIAGRAAPTVSVVIPARDAAGTLPRTLDALAAQDEPADEVIVVDDGSADGTAELAGGHAVVDRVLRQDGAGPGAARNRGWRAARGEVVAFTDADCFPLPAWLATARRLIAGADLVQGAVRPERRAGVFDRTVSVTGAHGLFETANLVVRRPVLEALGGFEPWLMPADGKELGEDVWLGWRATRAGLRVAFAPELVVEHAVIPRSARAAIAEQRRLQHFPAMTARIPELRSVLCFRRVFLSRRTAAFDAAVAGVAAAALARRPALALAALPYTAMLAREARPQPRRLAARLVAARIAADAVGAGGLARGSVAARSLLL
jgi:hypothetical protein